MVTGNREGFCATPPYARKVKSTEIEKFANALCRAGKATLLVQTVTGNNFEPCDRFVTSCTVAQKSSESVEAVKVDFDSTFIFNLMPNKIDESILRMQNKDKVIKKVGLAINQCIVLQKSTRQQCSSQLWRLKRSKRLTSSIFGRVINRKENIYPKAIYARTKGFSSPRSQSLQWGNDNENIAIKKYEAEFCNQQQGLRVAKCGLFINPQWPWLGASPDGVLLQDGQAVRGIEIQCPFSRKEKTIEDACKDQ